MITQVLHGPYCQGTDIVRHGTTPEGKQRYRCRECLLGRGRTFLREYAYAGQSPDVKQQIVDMAMNASGIHRPLVRLTRCASGGAAGAPFHAYRVASSCTHPQSSDMFPLNHEKKLANRRVEPGPRKPLPGSTTSLRRITSSKEREIWVWAGVRPESWGRIRCGGGGGAAGGTEVAELRRPLGNRGRMGVLVFLSGRFRAHRSNVLSSNLHPNLLANPILAECGLYLTCKVNSPTMVYEPKLFPVNLPVI